MNAIVKREPVAMTTVTTVQTIDEVIRLADIFAKSGMFQGESGSQSSAQLVVKIMAGQEIGIAPFAAANGMQIIKGKCAPGANLMAAKVKSSGKYDYAVQRMDDQACEVAFYQQGTKVGVSAFTVQDAQKAGTQNMGKFPRNMLFARAMSNGVRWYCPDIFNGVTVYTPDEMGAQGDYTEDGDFVVIEAEKSTPQPPQERRQATPATPAANVLNTLTVETSPPPQESIKNGKPSTPHTRLFGEGTQTFGPKWDEVRPKIVHLITAGGHTSESNLTDEEREALTESFKTTRKTWQQWARTGDEIHLPNNLPIREVEEMSEGDKLFQK